jgi:hypothetical protein
MGALYLMTDFLRSLKSYRRLQAWDSPPRATDPSKEDGLVIWLLDEPRLSLSLTRLTQLLILLHSTCILFKDHVEMIFKTLALVVSLVNPWIG